MKHWISTAVVWTTVLSLVATAAAAEENSPSATAAATDWIKTSNGYADILLEVIGTLTPENAGAIGVAGLDENITDIREGYLLRTRTLFEGAISELEQGLATETDQKVQEDLGILIAAGQSYLRRDELSDQYLLYYLNVARYFFDGIKQVLQPQVSSDRYPAAIVRLERYAGIADGYEPFTQLAMNRSIERFGMSLLGPFLGEVEQDLALTDTYITGIEDLFVTFELDGWQEAYETLVSQLQNYSDWVQSEIVPRARSDFRAPPEIYAYGLQEYGVHEDPEVLIGVGKVAYDEIVAEMEALAPLVAAKMGYNDTDHYTEIISKLMNDGQIPGDEVLDFYTGINAAIEEIIVRETLVTLPERETGIRLASPAESAAIPVPYLEIPPLINNTGERPFFVIPYIGRNDDGSWETNGFVYEAFTWTVTAHEARPGHEMQFSSVIESGTSIARALFAWNSANSEGWGVYSEWTIMYPYFPIEAQLTSLQSKLWRAARLFLDPQLNLGLVTADEAKKLLMDGVGLLDSVAQSEINRYTFQLPGQATSYYYGYIQLTEMRAQAELELLRDDGSSLFDQQAFHDFILNQGLIPLSSLATAVMEEFVPSQMMEGDLAPTTSPTTTSSAEATIVVSKNLWTSFFSMVLFSWNVWVSNG